MASRIEEMITNIEDYLDECKPTMFNSSKITVDRDELEGYIQELRMKIPDEIRQYQKIISNREAIIAEAQRKADDIISQAQIQTNQLVSEHQIMQQAYAQANEVVMIATKNAEDMLNKAQNEANEVREGAMKYTDDLLANIEAVIANSMQTTQARTEGYLQTMQGYLDVVVANRQELNPPAVEPLHQPVKTEAIEEPAKKPEAKAEDKKADEDDDLPQLDISIFN